MFGGKLEPNSQFQSLLPEVLRLFLSRCGSVATAMAPGRLLHGQVYRAFGGRAL